MKVLEGLEPEKVFYYFEEICSIPHGSGNTAQISEYLKSFAIKKGLRYIQDEAGNVIIFKGGTADYESSPAVMLQGHMDMVCEKEHGAQIDMKTEGLKLIYRDGIISADGTTLGGDDGIAVAFALAILDSDDIPHPPLEAVFTVDEEIGMLGAAAMDCSPLSSRTMLNLDSEEEGYLLVSCAGGVSAACHIPLSYDTVTGRPYTVTVSGLSGGHSGTEIDKGRANANVILARVLYRLKAVVPFCITDIHGGLKDNAIPREAEACIIIRDTEGVSAADSFITEMDAILKNEYAATDAGICISGGESASENVTVEALSSASTNAVITALFNLPSGITRMSFDIPGLVQSSLNPGVLMLKDDEAYISYCIRSSVASEKQEMCDRIESMMQLIGGYVTYTGDYPAWEYRKDSPLRDLMIDIYRKQYGSEPVVQALHAGVECGLFSGKIPGLDCVSYGPNMQDIHTSAESMEVASVKRTWDYTLEILKNLK